MQKDKCEQTEVSQRKKNLLLVTNVSNSASYYALRLSRA